MKLLQFLDTLKAAGTIRSDSGTPIHVSANGTTTASASALDRIIRERFKDMRTERVRANGHAAEDTPE
jgi:hypothetical protein